MRDRYLSDYGIVLKEDRGTTKIAETRKCEIGTSQITGIVLKEQKGAIQITELLKGERYLLDY